MKHEWKKKIWFRCMLAFCANAEWCPWIIDLLNTQRKLHRVSFGPKFRHLAHKILEIGGFQDFLSNSVEILYIKMFPLSIYNTRTAMWVCCLTTELTGEQMNLSPFKLSETEKGNKWHKRWKIVQLLKKFHYRSSKILLMQAVYSTLHSLSFRMYLMFLFL